MKVKLDIPYPQVEVEEKNPYYAELLSQNYAGTTSETTAVMTYSFQHLSKFNENEEFAKIMEEIAEVEMKHMELLGETIKLLGKEPEYKTCESLRGDCIMWSSKNVNYTTNLKEILTNNIKSEEAAIRYYKEHKKEINDKYIKKLIDRILLDEQEHIKIFSTLLEELC